MTTPEDPLAKYAEPAPRLDRAEILRTAIELLDREGFDAFSMRKLATALNMKSPSLYWHVRSKDELFDLLVDAVWGKCPLPAEGSSEWEERLMALGLDLRQTLLSHPAVARLMPGRTPLGPNGLRVADHIVGILRRAGFDNRLASYGYLLMVFYVVGFATQELAFGKGEDNPTRLGEVSAYLRALPANDYPDLVAVADDLAGPPGLTDRFRLGLRGILDRLATERAEATDREGGAVRA